MLSHAPMVKYLATRTLRGAPAHVSLDDLVSAGLMRLVQSVEGFDPRSVQLRAVRLDARLRRHPGRAAPCRLGAAQRPPTPPRDRVRPPPARPAAGPRAGQPEIAEHLGVPRADVEDALNAARRADISSLNSVTSDGEEGGVEVIDTVADDARTPEQSIVAGERSRVIREALSTLTEREQLIVRVVFVEGRSAREASGMIGVSESRVSQVTTQIRRKLAARLAHYDAQAA